MAAEHGKPCYQVLGVVVFVDGFGGILHEPGHQHSLIVGPVKAGQVGPDAFQELILVRAHFDIGDIIAHIPENVVFLRVKGILKGCVKALPKGVQLLLQVIIAGPGAQYACHMEQYGSHCLLYLLLVCADLSHLAGHVQIHQKCGDNSDGHEEKLVEKLGRRELLCPPDMQHQHRAHGKPLCEPACLAEQIEEEQI